MEHEACCRSVVFRQRPSLLRPHVLRIHSSEGLPLHLSHKMGAFSRGEKASSESSEDSLPGYQKPRPKWPTTIHCSPLPRIRGLSHPRRDWKHQQQISPLEIHTFSRSISPMSYPRVFPMQSLSTVLHSPIGLHDFYQSWPLGLLRKAISGKESPTAQTPRRCTGSIPWISS